MNKRLVDLEEKYYRAYSKYRDAQEEFVRYAIGAIESIVGFPLNLRDITGKYEGVNECWAIGDYNAPREISDGQAETTLSDILRTYCREVFDELYFTDFIVLTKSESEKIIKFIERERRKK